MANQNQFDGPFTGQLSQPFQAPKNPAAEAGYGGVGSGIMHFVTNFLEGASRSRLAKQAEAEMQRHRNIQALTGLMEQADKMGLAPEGRAAVQQQIMSRLLPEVAGADNGVKGKDASGNPMFNFVKGMANSLLPPGATKSKPIDATAIGELYQFIGGQPTVKRLHEEALQLAHEAAQDPSMQLKIGDQTYLDPNKIGQSQKYMEALKRIEASGSPSAAFNAFQERMLPPSVAAGYAQKQANIEAINSFMGGGAKPQPAPGFDMRVAGATPQPQAASGMPSAITSMGGAVAPGAERPTSDATPIQQVAQLNSQANRPPFLTGQQVPYNVQVAMREEYGAPKQMYATNRRTREVYPIQEYGGGIVGVHKGERIDPSKLDPNQWQYDSTAPTEQTKYTPEEIDATAKNTRALIDRYAQLYPKADFNGRFTPSIETSLKMKDPISAFGNLDKEIRTYADKLDVRDDAENNRNAIRGMAATNAEAIRNDRRFSNIERVRNDIGSSAEYKAYVQSRTIMDQVKGAMEQAMSGKGNKESVIGILDRQLTYAQSKLADAQSAVREGEIKLWQDVMSVIGNFKVQLGNLFSDSRKLYDPQTRNTMYGLLTDSMKRMKKSVYDNSIAPRWKSVQKQYKDVEAGEIVPGDFMEFTQKQSSPKSVIDHYGDSGKGSTPKTGKVLEM